MDAPKSIFDSELDMLSAVMIAKIALAFLFAAVCAFAQIEVLPVQGNVYMLTGAGANVTLQVGENWRSGGRYRQCPSKR